MLITSFSYTRPSPQFFFAIDNSADLNELNGFHWIEQLSLNWMYCIKLKLKNIWLYYVFELAIYCIYKLYQYFQSSVVSLQTAPSFCDIILLLNANINTFYPQSIYVYSSLASISQYHNSQLVVIILRTNVLFNTCNLLLYIVQCYIITIRECFVVIVLSHALHGRT